MRGRIRRTNRVSPQDWRREVDAHLARFVRWRCSLHFMWTQKQISAIFRNDLQIGGASKEGQRNRKRGRKMYLIVGLGNPGIKYEKTRHNVGFHVIDLLSEQYQIPVTQEKHRALIGRGTIEGQAVLLVKPQTFMNLSGESVAELLHYYRVEPEHELVVISDDVMLDVGMLRIRRKGSAGGHNGLKNIIACCGTEGFARVRLGVGRLPANRNMIDHVLGRFSEEEQTQLKLSCERGARAIVCMITQDIDTAMNLYNGKVEE